jgi:hypothetical protein
MISNGGPTTTVVTAPPGPITLPQNATLVSDADDEIFLLYTRLAALKPADSSDTGHFHGLGSENPNQDSLHVCIELKPPILTSEPPRNTETGNQRRKRRRGSGAAKAKEERRGRDPIVFEYVLLQDKTALRSRSGDTGSVLWKTRWACPSGACSFPKSLFSCDSLRRAQGPYCSTYLIFQCRVSIYGVATTALPREKSQPLRLREAKPSARPRARVRAAGSLAYKAATNVLPSPGMHRAGTGLLALALSPLVRKYTATDIPALLPLLRKNVRSASASVTVTALDWTLPALRQVDDSDVRRGPDAPDVLLAVDCIYHPALVQPLLTTLTALATPQHTAAVVVAELRAEDVLREFLQEWIALGWRVWSVGEDLLGARWGMWVAWRER